MTNETWKTVGLRASLKADIRSIVSGINAQHPTDKPETVTSWVEGVITKALLAKEIEENAVALLKKCHTGDIERDHGNADTILVGLVRKLGYLKVADAYDAIEPKHCA